MFDFLKRGLGGGQKRLNVSTFYQIPLDDFAATGERDAVLASSGMGKSYLTGVIAEETLENGGLLCVIDPEGEYFTLAERYPILIVGGDRGMVPLDESAIDLYVEMMLGTHVSLIFDLSDYLDEEQVVFYSQIAESVFQLETRYRKKVRMIIEEAQIYAPQRMAASPGKGPKKHIDPVHASQKLAKRGRKRAIDTLWATQRPASLSKDILSQCNRFWFGGITAEQDYKAIRPFLNEAGISFNDVKTLTPGEFYIFTKGQTKKIKVRKRLCKHAGATPEAQKNFAAVTTVGLESAIAELVKQVKQRQHEKREEEAEIKKLKAQVRTLELANKKLIAELEQERTATKVIERLGSQNAEEIEALHQSVQRRKRTRKVDPPTEAFEGLETEAV